MDVVSRVRVSGQLAGHAAGFAADLAGAGYVPESVAGQVRVLAHLSRWLGERGLEPGVLTAERVEEFAAARRAGGYRQWVSVRGLGPVLEYLRGRGVVPGPVARVPVSAVEVLLERYRGYLVSERGLAPATVRYYQPGPPAGHYTGQQASGGVSVGKSLPVSHLSVPPVGCPACLPRSG